MFTEMQFLVQNSLVQPSKWVVELANLPKEEILEYACQEESINPYLISSTIESSLDPDELMSAFCTLHFLVKRDLDCKKIFVDLINDLSLDRWIKMISSREDVASECIRLFRFLRDPPSSTLIKSIYMPIVSNLTAVELLVDCWIEKKWDLKSGLMRITQQSYSAWRFIKRYCYSTTSFGIIHEIQNLLPSPNAKICLNKLLYTNGSALEYLMHLDKINADGIKSTFDSINGFDLWKIVVYNPAARPIVDYAMKHFYKVKNGKFSNQNEFAMWIGKYPVLTKHLCDVRNAEQLDRVLHSRFRFYMNMDSLSIIQNALESYPELAIPTVLSSLVVLASLSNKYIATSAIKVIDKYFKMPFDAEYEDLEKLLTSPHGYRYIINILEEDDYLVHLLRSVGVVPTLMLNETELEDGDIMTLPVWMNFNSQTVHNIKHDPILWSQINSVARLLTYGNWNTL